MLFYWWLFLIAEKPWAKIMEIEGSVKGRNSLIGEIIPIPSIIAFPMILFLPFSESKLALLDNA